MTCRLGGGATSILLISSSARLLLVDMADRFQKIQYTGGNTSDYIDSFANIYAGGCAATQSHKSIFSKNSAPHYTHTHICF